MRTKRFIFRILIVATVVLPLVMAAVAGAESGCHARNCGGNDIATGR